MRKFFCGLRGFDTVDKPIYASQMLISCINRLIAEVWAMPRHRHCLLCQPRTISIHAPTMGRLWHKFPGGGGHRISTHAPIMGATAPLPGGRALGHISIHTPRGDRRCPSSPPSRPYFNPRPHYEGDSAGIRPFATASAFQPTPRRAACEGAAEIDCAATLKYYSTASKNYHLNLRKPQ